MYKNFLVIFFLLSSVVGKILNANDQKKCQEPCRTCKGVSFFLNERCECYEIEPGHECIGRIKREAEEIGFDLVECDLPKLHRIARCSFFTKKFLNNCNMNRVVDKIIGYFNSDASKFKFNELKIKCTGIDNKCKKEQNRCLLDGYDKSKETKLNSQRNFQLYPGHIFHSLSFLTNMDKQVKSEEFIDEDQDKYDDSHNYNDDDPASSSIINFLEKSSTSYKKLYELDERTDESSRRLSVSSPLGEDIKTQPNWTLDGSSHTSTLDNNSTNEQLNKIIQSIQSLRSSITKEMIDVLEHVDSTESRN